MKIKCEKITSVESSQDGDNIFVSVESVLNYEDILNSLCIEFGTDRILKFFKDLEE
jgi:hypothetical protein